MGFLSKIFGPPQYQLGITQILDSEELRTDDKYKTIQNILILLSLSKRTEATNWLNGEFERRGFGAKERVKYSLYSFVYQLDLEAIAIRQKDGKWKIDVNTGSKGIYKGKNIALQESVNNDGLEMISIKIYD